MDRRDFIRKLGISGLSAAGIGAITGASMQLARAADATRDATQVTREEYEALKSKYENLDSRTKLIVRGMLVLLGLDILLI